MKDEREKYEVLMRLRAIELIAYWEGRLNTPHLIQHFGITRQQATNDIKRYVNNYNPEGLVYSPELKGYIPIEGFKPVLTQGHINEYMDFLSGLVSQSFPVTLIPEPNIAVVRLPNRAVKPAVVRHLITACRKRQVVQIRYASMNNPKAHERALSPHSLIYSGFRWHVRGYCHQNQEFRDFVISRISEIETVREKYHDASSDYFWHETVDLTLVPNSNLNKDQQQLIANDYGMEKGRLPLNVKKALLHYTLHRYQVAITPEEENECFKYPLILDNMQAVNSLLFNSEAKNGNQESAAERDQ